MAKSDFYNTRKNRFEWKLVILILIIMLIGKGVNKVKEFFTGDKEDKPTKAAVETIDDTSKDREDKSITEVQEPEKREDLPASTTVDDTFSTTTGDEPDWYIDPPSAAVSTSGLDDVPVYNEETLSDWTAYIEANGLTYYHQDERTDEDNKIAANILISVDHDEASMTLFKSVLRCVSDYTMANKKYLDDANLTADDVLEISNAVADVMQTPDDYVTVSDPADPNSLLCIYINGSNETWRVKYTAHEDRNSDAEPTLNKAVYMELLDAEVRKAVGNMG